MKAGPTTVRFGIVGAGGIAKDRAAGIAAALTVFLFFRGGVLVDAARRAADVPAKTTAPTLVHNTIDQAPTSIDPRSSQSEAADRSGH